MRHDVKKREGRAMSAMPKPQPTTEAEYLALEMASERRHEFIDGEIRAMVGASEPHSAIASSLSFLLYSGLRDKPCRVYQGDMRVRISAAGNYVYPDLVVVKFFQELLSFDLLSYRNKSSNIYTFNFPLIKA